MSKRSRGLSLDEKRKRMQQLLFDTKEVFTLKELEKIGAKKGVVAQSVKDVLETLHDDALLELEKIGSSNFYWAFPSKALIGVQNKRDKAVEDIATTSKEIEALEADIAKLREERCMDSRADKLAQLAATRAEIEKLDAQLLVQRENDPAALQEMREKTEICKQACERWTDNVWAMKDYLVKKHSMVPKQVDQAMGIPEEFDYLE